MKDGPSERILPTWLECPATVAAGMATALQRFIAANEPSHPVLCDPFKHYLGLALDEAAGRRVCGRAPDASVPGVKDGRERA